MSVAEARIAYKAELVRDLGGDVSTQEAAVVDLAVARRARAATYRRQPGPLPHAARPRSAATFVYLSGCRKSEVRTLEFVGEDDFAAAAERTTAYLAERREAKPRGVTLASVREERAQFAHNATTGEAPNDAGKTVNA